jgi:hypothetical protein
MSIFFLLLTTGLVAQSWELVYETGNSTGFTQDPVDSNRVIFFSQGVAGSWEIIELEGPTVVRQEALTLPLGHLAINPLNSDHWLMARNNSIQRSDDRGTTWRVIEDTLLHEMEWQRTWIPVLDTSRYYAGSGGPYPGSLYRYKGQSWQGYGGIEPTCFVQRRDHPSQFLYSGIYWSDSQIYLMDMITDERTNLLTGDTYDDWWEGGDTFHTYRFWPIPDPEAERYLVSARMNWNDQPGVSLGFAVLSLDGTDAPTWSPPEFVDYLPYNYSTPEFKQGQLFVPVRPNQDLSNNAGVAFSGDLGQTWGLLDTTGLPQNNGSGVHIIHTIYEDTEQLYFSAPRGIYRAELPLDIIDSYVAINPEPQAPAAFTLGEAYPNPFNGSICIPFSFDGSEEELKLEIMDVRGRTLAEIDAGQLGPGTHEWTWTGIDAQGAMLPSGVYLVRMMTKTTQASTKILLLK